MTVRWISFVPSPTIMRGASREVSLDIELGRISVSAVDAYCGERYLHGHLGAEQFGHACFGVGSSAGVQRARGVEK